MGGQEPTSSAISEYCLCDTWIGLFGIINYTVGFSGTHLPLFILRSFTLQKCHQSFKLMLQVYLKEKNKIAGFSVIL